MDVGGKNQNGFPRYKSSIALVNFLTPLPEYAGCIAGFLEASGGDPTGLAATCLRRISANHKDPNADLHALDADIRVVVSLSGRRNQSNKIHEVLLKQKSLAVIAGTMYKLASSPNPVVSPIMFSCLTFCAAYLRYYKDASSHMIFEAMESLLILALLLSGPWLLQDSASTMLREIRCEMVGVILPRYLMFRSILRKADRSLKWIHARGLETQDTQTGQFGQAWIKLKERVQDCMMIEAHSALYIVCENPAVSPILQSHQIYSGDVQCDCIKERKEFMRCSGCLACYFCSRKCLKHSWKHANHRTQCKSVQAQRHGMFSLYPVVLEDLTN